MPDKEDNRAVDYDRMVGRDDKDEDLLADEKDMDGDVLVLDPEKIGKRLPNFQFEKQIGRPDLEENKDYETDEQLILEPNIDVIRKRQPTAPDFDKQIGRVEPQKLEDMEDEIYIRRLDDPPIPYDPSVPKVVAHDFGAREDRFPEGMNGDLALELGLV